MGNQAINSCKPTLKSKDIESTAPGKNPRRRGVTKDMYRCAMYGKDKDIDKIIAYGDNLHEVDRYGRNTMHYACLAGNLMTAKRLMNEKIDFNLGDKEGYTPLHWVSMCNSPEVVQFLYENGAVMNARDNEGNTPLHRACELGKVTVITTLLRCGADPEATNTKDQTPAQLMQEAEIAAGLKAKIEKVLKTIRPCKSPRTSISTRGSHQQSF